MWRILFRISVRWTLNPGSVFESRNVLPEPSEHWVDRFLTLVRAASHKRILFYRIVAVQIEEVHNAKWHRPGVGLTGSNTEAYAGFAKYASLHREREVELNDTRECKRVSVAVCSLAVSPISPGRRLLHRWRPHALRNSARGATNTMPLFLFF